MPKEPGKGKKPTSIRKGGDTSVQLFGRIANVEVKGRGSDAALIVTISAKLDQHALRQKLALDKMWERQIVGEEERIIAQIDETS